MVVLQGHIVVPDTDLLAVRAELPNHIELTRNEVGCLRFDVTQDPNDPHVFVVYEVFVDRVAFEAHQQRVGTSAWGRVAAAAERHYSVSETWPADASNATTETQPAASGSLIEQNGGRIKGSQRGRET